MGYGKRDEWEKKDKRKMIERKIKLNIAARGLAWLLAKGG